MCRNLILVKSANEISPCVTVHLNFFSWVIVFSIMGARTVFLLYTTSFPIWQQAIRTHTPWDALWTHLHNMVNLVTVYLVAYTYKYSLFRNIKLPASGSYTFRVHCVATLLALWPLFLWLCFGAIEENHGTGAYWWQWYSVKRNCNLKPSVV